jgi:hypothetical protein
MTSQHATTDTPRPVLLGKSHYWKHDQRRAERSACQIQAALKGIQQKCYMHTFFLISHHHSKRAVLCIVMPYTIQRFLCVMNGHYCVTIMITRPLWPSQTTWASQANIHGLLCCLRALQSSCSTSLLS